MAFLTEADTCRRYVLPKLYAADWIDEQISEQKSFTDGRIVVAGTKVKRRPQKRADYLLRYRRDFPIAVVEAKTIYAKRGDGLQQAKEYAQILGEIGYRGPVTVEVSVHVSNQPGYDGVAAAKHSFDNLAPFFA